MMAETMRRAGVVLQDGAGDLPLESALESAPESAYDTLGLAARPGALVGLAMRIADRTQAEEAVSGPAFEVAAVAVDGSIACVLGRFGEDEIVAAWRRLGAASGLPLMLQNPDGSLCAPYPQIGPLALGETRQRRRHGLLSGRRPRFLTRRKTGRPAALPLVFREREIVGGR